MSVVHTGKSIPTIPGLTPHPVQVAAQQRLDLLKRTDPSLAKAIIETQKKPGVMPDPTRDMLRRLSESLRKANSLAVPVKAGDAKANGAKTGQQQ